MLNNVQLLYLSSVSFLPFLIHFFYRFEISFRVSQFCLSFRHLLPLSSISFSDFSPFLDNISFDLIYQCEIIHVVRSMAINHYFESCVDQLVPFFSLLYRNSISRFSYILAHLVCYRHRETSSHSVACITIVQLNFDSNYFIYQTNVVSSVHLA